jgi:hypothetical protein
MIFNCDGTPYVLGGSIDQFDPNNSDIGLLNQYDQEITQISGSPVLYYEVMIQVGNRMDPLYREDRSKIWNPTPVKLYAFYTPVPTSNFVNMFGIDAPDEIQLEFNYLSVLKVLGHPPKIGSRIWTPQLGESWVVVQNGFNNYQLWNTFKIITTCQRFQESTTTNEGKVTNKEKATGLTDPANWVGDCDK